MQVLERPARAGDEETIPVPIHEPPDEKRKPPLETPDDPPPMKEPPIQPGTRPPELPPGREREPIGDPLRMRTLGRHV